MIKKKLKLTKNRKIKPGVCRKCGCTENNACYVTGVGSCWWVDDTKTLCSHCFYNFREKTLDEIEKELKERKNIR